MISDTGEQLRRSVVSAPSQRAAPDDAIDTALVAIELLADDLPQDYPATLDWLCRKIQVAGNLKNFYRSGWKKHPDSSPLDETGWRGVLVALLVCAEQMGSGRPEEDVGRALKCINALLVGAEIVSTKTNAAPDPVIEQEAMRLLGVLTTRGVGERERGR